MAHILEEVARLITVRPGHGTSGRQPQRDSLDASSAHGVEGRARARRLVEEVFGAVWRDDKTEAFVRDPLDCAVCCCHCVDPLRNSAEIGHVLCRRVSSHTNRASRQGYGPIPQRESVNG